MLAMEVTTPLVESIRTTFLASPSRRNLQGKVADQIRAKAIKARALGKAVRETPLARHTNVGANKLIRHLSFVFSWGVKTDRLPRMPFKRLKDLVEQEPVKTFLRLEQVKPFLAELDRLNNLHVMVAVRAMLYLGLREDEAMHMRWTGFDGPRKVYTATDTKTGENIPLPVPKDLRRLLETLRGVVDEGCPWCLPSCYDHRAKAWRVHFAQFTAKAIRRAGKKLGITGLRPHRMRGSMATLMARSGANAFVIKKAGRWKRMDTALRYVQVVEDDVTEAQRKAFDFDD
jgi:integrase